MKQVPFEPLDPGLYREIVRRALAEDLGWGDVTTEATVAAELKARGIILAKSPCVIAGVEVAAEAFRQLDPAVAFTVQRGDGERCAPGDVVAEVRGMAASMLTAERTALNLMQRMTGIATLTRRFVDAAGGRIVILDTRKTTPTLRALEKYAVRAGGGTNHRGGLDDGILIKDNHIRLGGGVMEAVRRMRAADQQMPIEIEAQSLDQVDEAIRAGADIVLLDNLSTERHEGGRAAHRRACQGGDLRRRHARSHSGARRHRRGLRLGGRPDALGAGRGPELRARARFHAAAPGERGCRAAARGLRGCARLERGSPWRFRTVGGVPAVTSSTNDVAQALAEGGAPQGAVAVAFAQTAGRGRQGREWFSPPGAGIYMSVVVRSPAVAPMLTLAGGVAVAEGIRRATGLPVLIKWPNDVVVEDAHAPGRRRKLAGILAEGSTGQSGLQHVVLGIGINVRPADYPPNWPRG